MVLFFFAIIGTDARIPLSHDSNGLWGDGICSTDLPDPTDHPRRHRTRSGITNDAAISCRFDACSVDGRRRDGTKVPVPNNAKLRPLPELDSIFGSA